MKATRCITAFFLTAAMLLFSSSAFSQVESRDNIKPGTIMFKPGSCTLSSTAQGSLDVLAGQMSGNPSFRVVINSTSGGSKPLQQLSWDRVNAVIVDMGERHNIDRNRFIFRDEGNAAQNTVNYGVAQEGDDGPSNKPAPQPDLRCH